MRGARSLVFPGTAFIAWHPTLSVPQGVRQRHGQTVVKADAAWKKGSKGSYIGLGNGIFQHPPPPTIL